MLEYMRAGGGIIWIITLLSFVALTVVLERLFFFYSEPDGPRKAGGRAGPFGCNGVQGWRATDSCGCGDLCPDTDRHLLRGTAGPGQTGAKRALFRNPPAGTFNLSCSRRA